MLALEYKLLACFLIHTDHPSSQCHTHSRSRFLHKLEGLQSLPNKKKHTKLVQNVKQNIDQYKNSLLSSKDLETGMMYQQVLLSS